LKAVLDRTIPLVKMNMERFEKAGEEYAVLLTLSPETIAALETPMIPKEEYIRQVNGA